MQEVRIERLGAAHLPFALRIAPEVFDHPLDPAHLAAIVEAPDHLLLIARNGDHVIGQCCASLHRHPDAPSDLYVENLGVTPDWQRRGVATDLVHAAKDWGRERGATALWIATEVDNAPARALYRDLDLKELPCVMFEGRL